MKLIVQTLSNNFVTLETLKSAHLPEILEIAGDERIWPYIPVNGADPKVIENWVTNGAAQAPENGTCYAVRLNSSGRIVGQTSYLNVSAKDSRLEIGGTWYHPDHWGGVVNPACKHLLLHHAFEDRGAVRVEIKTDARNARSRAAIEKLGAQFEGILRHHMLVQNGHQRDTAMFSILKEEWPGVSAKLQDRLTAFEGAE